MRRIRRGAPLASLALAAVLAAGPAMASDPAPTQPLQLPPLRAGAVMTFSAEDRVEQTDTPTAPVGTGRRWTFDLQVVKTDADGGAVVRYVLRSSASDGAYARGDPFWTLETGVAVDFDVDPTGMPRDIVNFDAIKAPFLAHYPNPGSVKAGLLDQALVWMAPMQLRDPIAPGHSVLAAGPAVDDFRHVARSIDYIGFDGPACRAKIERTSTQTLERTAAPPIVDGLMSTAMVSTADGWVVSLDERTSGGIVAVHTVRRVTPAGCGR